MRQRRLTGKPLGESRAGLALFPAAISAHPHFVNGVGLGQGGHRLGGVADAHQQVAAALEQLAAQGDQTLPEKAQARRADARGVESRQRVEPGTVEYENAQQRFGWRGKVKQGVVGQAQITAQPHQHPAHRDLS